MQTFQLGPWTFIPADFSIYDGDKRTELEPLLCKLLQCFAASPGAIVSRQQLVETIWQQSYVDDNAINRAISELRKALQHPKLPQSPIKTHHRKGYSLLPAQHRAAKLLTQPAP
ncbi:winged helix-turn-helix domain-containing protein [Rheinheimera sp.]|uniref:winged helix-turn-helix domain-containing protein n=1 Tax=Rheinheimera sp. TaxID=1869214 RepID=UPI004048C245